MLYLFITCAADVYNPFLSYILDKHVDDNDNADYDDDDQADDDIDDLLMHSRTLNHSRLGLLRSNDRLRQNLSRAITVTKVKIPS